MCLEIDPSLLVFFVFWAATCVTMPQNSRYATCELRVFVFSVLSFLSITHNIMLWHCFWRLCWDKMICRDIYLIVIYELFYPSNISKDIVFFKYNILGILKIICTSLSLTCVWRRDEISGIFLRYKVVRFFCLTPILSPKRDRPKITDQHLKLTQI